MTKEYSADITIKFTQFGFEADSEDDFINKLKHSFDEEHNIKLDDSEIENVKFLDSFSDLAITRKMARKQGIKLERQKERIWKNGKTK
tara:strand:- start:76 stop:339 length:264 start_codon:yes stop_codon:yes gene_type:complete